MRSLTIGVPIWTCSQTQLADQLHCFLERASAALGSAGSSTRTVRLTLPMVPGEVARQPGAVASMLVALRQMAAETGARWYCLPLDLISGAPWGPLLAEVLDLLVKDQRLFVNLVVADNTTISVAGARAAAEFVLNIARRSHNGFDAFRVGVSCAGEANTPFFPFSLHEGENMGFSLALETMAPAILALRASSRDSSLADKQQVLQAVLRERIQRADSFGRRLEMTAGVDYVGLDASYAPYPDGDTSLGSLVECFGISPVGSNGTLFVTSILTDALKAALSAVGARCAGFNGVMYSVLEDPSLASSNNLACLSLEKLLLFSSLCGCGIDMAPIPATTYVEDVSALILDVAALAVRLAKPLGVRLMPIPNRRVNEYASFNQDFLLDSRVMNPGTSDSTFLFAGSPPWKYRSMSFTARSDSVE